MSKIHTQLDPQVLVNKYSLDFIEEYEINNTTTPWVQELLEEMEDENDDEADYPDASMNIKAQIKRKNNQLLKDHLVVRAQINTRFHLPCGRCLYPLEQVLDLNLAAAFLHDSNAKLPEYAESTTVYADGEEMELYFFTKGLADLKEFLHEQIFIEMAPFPRCEGECKNPVHF